MNRAVDCGQRKVTLKIQKEIQSEDILNLPKKTVCSCKTSNTAEAIYFAHSKSKRKFKSDEQEKRF